MKPITRDIAAERNELAAEASATPEHVTEITAANDNEIAIEPVQEIELGEIAANAGDTLGAGRLTWPDAD